MNILINNSLYENLNKSSTIVSKEKELNKISLKKYEGDKYGFCKKIVNKTINYENINNVFNTTLDDIESIYSNDEEKK